MRTNASEHTSLAARIKRSLALAFVHTEFKRKRETSCSLGFHQQEVTQQLSTVSTEKGLCSSTRGKFRWGEGALPSSRNFTVMKFSEGGCKKRVIMGEGGGGWGGVINGRREFCFLTMLQRKMFKLRV